MAKHTLDYTMSALFPGDRVERTTLSHSGLELKRKLGYAYINGFNHIMMTTFKCHHDIQVLLGGKDATE
ncbi:hypothetical protein JG687_00008295 [Phytophthora cactorum]|uniref:Uncharacterized protein n=1 Tax=Phytophthora cactorum TaxID=29920 RepID=A0A8T1UCQ5_9STRA|nr:hypothetical protein JG687_00008295 [Phytophthora cactorum]